MNKYLKLLPIIIIFLLATQKRLGYFYQKGKDVYAYERAITDLLEGKNPYEWTIESYSNPDDPGNHGYAYLPGVLYLFTPLYIVSFLTKFPVQYLWKLPVLLADLGVGILFIKAFKKKNYFGLLAALLVWFFNPYSYFRSGYTYTEPITIFFMFLSLIYLEKDSVLTGTFYSLSIVFKTFPYILLPVYLLKTKNWRKFIAACLIVGIFVSLPFMRSVDFFADYIKGSILVHSNRFVQGRPLLWYIRYYYSIEFFELISFKTYTLLASFSGWFVVLALYFYFKVRDKYILSLIPFLSFYLFTPVFNRTYVMWFIPVFVLSMHKIFSGKYRFMYFLSLALYFCFFGWYLVQWRDGFHIWHP